MSISEIYQATPPPSPASSAEPAHHKAGGEFKAILNKELQLSQHAATRIRSRSIAWDARLEKRISGGIEAAEKKGGREVLILVDSVAVIANVKTKTIVTAMDRDQLKERVFTNIDSAVFV